LAWWAFIISGPIGAIAAGLGLLRPRQRIAIGVGAFIFIAWLIFWIFILVAASSE
jgi:hypothetical protein